MKSKTVGIVVGALAVVVMSTAWSSLASAAPTVVLDETWGACTPTNEASLYPVASSAPDLSGGTAGIPIKTYIASPGVQCPDWAVTANTQTWLSVVYDGTTGAAQATSQRGIYLNEGGGGAGAGQIKRSLTGLRPGAFYEIIVEAWRDASSADTYLNVLVESGSYERKLELSFDVNSNGVQTIRGQFDVGASTAVVTLTGGTKTMASPIVKSVVIRSATDDNPEVVASPAPSKWTLTYDANGGVCSKTSQTDIDGSWVTTPGTSGCSRKGFTFTSWNTAKDGSGSGFAPGASIQLSGDNTLYAQWTRVVVKAINESLTARPNTPLSGSVATNDSFPTGSVFTLVNGPSRGTLVLNPDGTFTYRPAPMPRTTTRARG